MSNNAVNAYEEGLVPASKIPGVPAKLVKEYCYPAEWHHTSCQYNKTDFFRTEYVLATFGKISHAEYEVNPNAVKALHDSKKEKDVEVYKDCRVEWLEWSGSRSHSKCTNREVLEARVEVKGQTATIFFKDGGELVKRLDTNGFEFTPGYTAIKKKEDAAEKKRLALQKSNSKMLPTNLQTAGYRVGEKVWAAISKGLKVVDIAKFDGPGSSDFQDYRRRIKAELAEKGAVLTGTVQKFDGEYYFSSQSYYAEGSLKKDYATATEELALRRRINGMLTIDVDFTNFEMPIKSKKGDEYKLYENTQNVTVSVYAADHVLPFNLNGSFSRGIFRVSISDHGYDKYDLLFQEVISLIPESEVASFNETEFHKIASEYVYAFVKARIMAAMVSRGQAPAK